MPSAIVDTGPLVAFLSRSEHHHHWAIQRIQSLEGPLLVCEPVLVETMYLLGAFSRAQDMLLSYLERGALIIAFRIDEHVPALRALLVKYRDRPMSLADACIVRMAELYDRHAILTLDSDFSVYRKHGRIPLDIIQPPTG